MYDLNCPNCGTTYQSTEPGYCECCGFEFTDAFINKIIEAENERQKEIQRKIEEEKRQKQLLIEKAERERQAKLRAEQKAREEAARKAREEREARERVAALAKKNNERYEKERQFSLAFQKFRSALAIYGIVLVVAAVIGSMIFSNELGVNFVVPEKAINDKIEAIKEEHFITVKFDENQNRFKKSKDTEDTMELTKGSVRLLNSISSLISEQSTFEEKITYIFPWSATFLNEPQESSE